MATKKKVKAVEPEVVSSVEPEVANGTTLVQMRCFFKHVQGTETPLVSLMGLNVFTSGNYVKTVIVRQLA